jgi:hypothetical protein
LPEVAHKLTSLPASRVPSQPSVSRSSDSKRIYDDERAETLLMVSVRRPAP